MGMAAPAPVAMVAPAPAIVAPVAPIPAPVPAAVVPPAVMVGEDDLGADLRAVAEDLGFGAGCGEAGSTVRSKQRCVQLN